MTTLRENIPDCPICTLPHDATETCETAKARAESIDRLAEEFRDLEANAPQIVQQ